ncbi:hypothetical protein EsH8_III_000834 [Colletotrichum jinshuiense]
MKKHKAVDPSRVQLPVAPDNVITLVKDSDGASSLTAISIDSDSDTSSTITLVDLFPDLAVIDSGEPDNNADNTSGDSTSAISSEGSSSDQSAQSTGIDSSQVCLKHSGHAKNLKKSKNKRGRASDTDSESGTEAETSSADTSTSGRRSEAALSEANSEAGMAESTTSGETSSNEYSTTSDASSEGGGASSSAQSSDPGNWTPSEDALIISMKEGGETWASIGNAINRGKNEVKKRWHVVKANAANSTESGGDTHTDKSQDDEKKSDDKPKTKAERKADRKAEKQKSKGEPDEKPEEVKRPEPKQKEAKKKKNKKKQKAAEETTPKTPTSDSNDDAPSSSYHDRLNLLRDTSSASESASSATSGDAADSPGYYERELARQERYIRHHVHPALYPFTATSPAATPRFATPSADRRPPSPADKRQRRDDAILAAVVSRREATKWLEMQANFYNVTGRMVPLHLIKARCEAEEDRGKVAGVRNWADSVAGSEELLDPNEGADVPDDALVGDED